MAMNPLKEMIPSNKKGRRWYVLDEKREGAVIGLMNKSSLRVVFTKRLYEMMIPQGISEIREIETNREIGAVGSWDMIFESKRDSHSVAGKGLR